MDKTDKLIDWEENERVDRNRDGIDDRIEPDVPDVSAGSRKLAERLNNDPLADPSITGGDVDSQWEGAQFSGDESAVSSMTTPEQDVVGDIRRAIHRLHREWPARQTRGQDLRQRGRVSGIARRCSLRDGRDLPVPRCLSAR